ncbi:uncharacterized protein LOC124653360 [Lolium rigidum]|uniref:uncharacterized protein LOC124652267 n=1 Tax=Lolium rigidum TaxID=89674 RepID=UPI001F5C2887|nr:uncharacterized protein LOC124652267 [Lolium rigidum]XP_047048382.1 uncharacterized protein LOC124653360 [Lolium rigidum]
MLPSSQMAIQLTLLLISCSLYSMYSSSSSSSSSFSTSSSLALLLLLVISTCLSLLFSNLRQLIKTSCSHKTSMEEEAVHHPDKSAMPQDDEVSAEDSGSLSGSSDCQVSEEWTEEASVSDDDDDDESLIEISLVDGHYVGQQTQCPSWKKEQDLVAGFLPDLMLDKRDFMDIYSEITEEDNMIEIDIARGSIKCTSFGIKA